MFVNSYNLGKKREKHHALHLIFNYICKRLLTKNPIIKDEKTSIITVTWYTYRK